MSNLLAKVIFCLLLLGLSHSMPHIGAFVDQSSDMIDRRGVPSSRGNAIYTALKEMSDAEKRDREIACKLFFTSSNCDFLQIPGMSEDKDHWRESGPGKR